MRDDLNIGNNCAVSRGWPSGRNTTGVELEKAVATPAKAFSAPGPYCIAKTPGGRPFDTRANPSAMWTPTRSWRQMTGLMPTAAAASMIGVVGKQNRVEMPSRLRISAITCITCIARSSRWMRLASRFWAAPRDFAGSALFRRFGGRAEMFDGPSRAPSMQGGIRRRAAGIGRALVTDFLARPHVTGVLAHAHAAVGPGRVGIGRRRRRGAGASEKKRTPGDQQQRQAVHRASMASAEAICQGSPGRWRRRPASSPGHAKCPETFAGKAAAPQPACSPPAASPTLVLGRRETARAGLGCRQPGSKTWMTRLAIISRVLAA